MNTTNQNAIKTALANMVQAVLTKAAETSGDASTWDGQTKADFTTALKNMFQGLTTLTTADVDAKVEQAILDLQNLTKADVGLGLVDNFATATKVEAEVVEVANAHNDKFMTQLRVLECVKAWWANEVSANPETLDTVLEFAQGIEANQDALETLNTLAGTKVNQTDFDAAINNINTAMAALIADDATFATGTATDKAASVKQVKDHVEAISNDDATKLATAFAEVQEMVEGTQPFPA